MNKRGAACQARRGLTSSQVSEPRHARALWVGGVVSTVVSAYQKTNYYIHFNRYFTFMNCL